MFRFRTHTAESLRECFGDSVHFAHDDVTGQVATYHGFNHIMISLRGEMQGRIFECAEIPDDEQPFFVEDETASINTKMWHIDAWMIDQVLIQSDYGIEDYTDDNNES